MSAGITIPLVFSTFYTCGIKEFTSLTQKDCINLLLKNNYTNSGSINILSDSVCSNYANGKKDLNCELRVELLRLSGEDIIDRLNKIGIQDFTSVTNALHVLVDNSSLSDNEKTLLVRCYESEDALTFIANVFQKCVSGDNCHPLSKKDITAIMSYRYTSVSTDDNSNSSTISIDSNEKSVSNPGIQPDTIVNDAGNSENLEWMRNYVPASMAGTSTCFIHNAVKAETVALELPQDYRAMIYALKPALTESILKTFSFEEFIQTMNIDIAYRRLQKGRLDYWQFEGAFESVLLLLERINFSKVSDFAIQLIGQFTLEKVDRLETLLRSVSNNNVVLLTSLIFDTKQSNIKLILFAHECSEKVEEQKLDSSHDGTHLYKIKKTQKLV